MKKEKDCRNLYKKYEMLREKAKLAAYDVGPGWEISSEPVQPKNIEEMNRVREVLLENCSQFLTEDELKELDDLDN